MERFSGPGVAEMLLQSHAGEITLLPCLPDQLPIGKVSGLMARGGTEVEMKWEKSLGLLLVSTTLLMR